MARANKAEAVQEIADSLRSSQATVLTEYRGLTVAQLKELRRSLAGKATYSVVKNTLTKIAARGRDRWHRRPAGRPERLAFVEGDPSRTAKDLRSFAKNNPPW